MTIRGSNKNPKSAENILRIIGGTIVGGLGFWFGANLFFWALNADSEFYAKLALIPGTLFCILASIISIIALKPNKTFILSNNDIEESQKINKSFTANQIMMIAALLTILAIALFIVFTEIL